MKQSLENKLCVVTGAAGGIGLGIAQAFAQAGAKVAMIDILAEQVQEQASKLAASNKNVRPYVLDITDRDAVLACFDQITQELGGAVYTLVNNAGVVDQRPFDEITAEQIDRMMRVNVNGTLFCCQGAAKTMKPAQQGRIINFSSKSGKTGSALMAHYSAAKGAIISLTHALAFELASSGINVNCLCPGITESTGVWSHVSQAYTENLKMPMDDVKTKFAAKIPLGRLTAIEDVVGFVMFLAADAAYCTGQAFNITGGREVH